MVTQRARGDPRGRCQRASSPARQACCEKLPSNTQEQPRRSKAKGARTGRGGAGRGGSRAYRPLKPEKLLTHVRHLRGGLGLGECLGVYIDRVVVLPALRPGLQEGRDGRGAAGARGHQWCERAPQGGPELYEQPGASGPLPSSSPPSDQLSAISSCRSNHLMHGIALHCSARPPHGRPRRPHLISPDAAALLHSTKNGNPSKMLRVPRPAPPPAHLHAHVVRHRVAVQRVGPPVAQAIHVYGFQQQQLLVRL